MPIPEELSDAFYNTVVRVGQEDDLDSGYAEMFRDQLVRLGKICELVTAEDLVNDCKRRLHAD